MERRKIWKSTKNLLHFHNKTFALKTEKCFELLDTRQKTPGKVQKKSKHSLKVAN